MDENNKELLKQIQLLMVAAETKQDRRADALDTKLETISNDFNSWRPRLESRVEELHASVTVLQQQAVGKATVGVTSSSALGDPAAAHLADAHRLVGTDPSVLRAIPPVGTDLGQAHGAVSLHRGMAAGVSTIQLPTPGTGMQNFQNPFNLRSAVSSVIESATTQLLAQMA